MNSPIDYATLFRDSPSACLVVSRDHVIVDVNAAYLRLAARTREELVGADVFDALAVPSESINAKQADALRASFERVFATGRSDTLPEIHGAAPMTSTDDDGLVDTPWRLSHHPLFDAAGKVVMLVQYAQPKPAPSGEAAAQAIRTADSDLAAAQSENRSLALDHRRLLQLFDQSLSFTVFMREPDHVVELANPTYLKMVSEEDLRNHSYAKAHRGDPPIPVKLLDAVYESGVPIIEQGLALRVPDGLDGFQTIYVDVVIQQIVDVGGKVVGVFMQGNDVTMAKATQDELHAYRTRLEEMVAERTRALERSETERRSAEAALHRAQRLEAVGKLTGGVAHDFNNVLQIIRGNLQLVQRNDADTTRVQQRIDAALDGVDRGAKLASQLLAFGRRQPLEPIVVDLGQVLERMKDLLHRALGESIEIRTQVPDDLWHTVVDVTRLENVILNIAINARDAMDHRGVLTMELQNALVDELHARRVDGLVPGDFVTLAISDTGSGMSLDVQRRAFEPFFTTKPEGEGTGLGLSMVYGFMKQSDGHVSLYSEQGQGTTIRLYLPRSEEPVTDVTVAPSAVSVRGNGETILVVEDDEAVRVTVIDTLLELGYRVLRANDGQSALTIVQSGVPIDLLFTDVIMPGPVASTELVRQAHLLMPRLRVLFTSGFTRDAIVHRDRLRAGVNLLSKPYAREDLARRLRQLLDDETAVAAEDDARPTAQAGDVAADAPTDAPAPSEPEAPSSTGPTRRRVLLVEDSEEVRETTVEFITEVGYDVVAVETAEAALESLATDRFDIIFTDISLPGINGIELLKRVRHADPHQCVVIASGYGGDLGRQNFGVGVGVLTKPYDLGALEKTLNDVLEAVAALKPAG